MDNGEQVELGVTCISSVGENHTARVIWVCLF